jgi:thiol-disulfide isomerase/thioredoxin
MNTRRFLVITFCLSLLCAASLGIVSTVSADAAKLYYYSAENCPKCREYGPLIHELAGQLAEIDLIEKDIWLDRSALTELVELLSTYGDLPLATPTLFLGDKVWIGIDHDKLQEIEAQLRKCIANGCPDALLRLQQNNGVERSRQHAPEDTVVSIPLLGKWDVREVSLPLVTLTLALLDSINPCAFFVLLFLLSLMIHARSRMRMLTVGMVFVTFSGLIYFLFMAAWLNLFLATGGIRFVTLLAGLVALLIGAFNIKDYFFFHKGPSLSIPEKAKPGLYHRVRNLIKSPSYFSLLGGTILLAVAANSYELLCTAGFPMVFTRILTLHGLTTWQYYSYLAFYNVIYVIPLLVIVIVFTVTLGAHQLTEKQGRWLKLISGVMMAGIGIVLVFFPTLLQSPTGAIAMFGAVFLCVAAILLIDNYWHRKPKT